MKQKVEYMELFEDSPLAGKWYVVNAQSGLIDNAVMYFCKPSPPFTNEKGGQNCYALGEELPPSAIPFDKEAWAAHLERRQKPHVQAK